MEIRYIDTRGNAHRSARPSARPCAQGHRARWRPARPRAWLPTMTLDEIVSLGRAFLRRIARPAIYQPLRRGLLRRGARRPSCGTHLRRQLRHARNRPHQGGCRRHVRARAVARPHERVQGHGAPVPAGVLLGKRRQAPCRRAARPTTISSPSRRAATRAKPHCRALPTARIPPSSSSTPTAA